MFYFTVKCFEVMLPECTHAVIKLVLTENSSTSLSNNITKSSEAEITEQLSKAIRFLNSFSICDDKGETIHYALQTVVEFYWGAELIIKYLWAVLNISDKAVTATAGHVCFLQQNAAATGLAFLEFFPVDAWRNMPILCFMWRANLKTGACPVRLVLGRTGGALGPTIVHLSPVLPHFGYCLESNSQRQVTRESIHTMDILRTS